MSAIAGIWYFDHQDDPARACAAILDAQAIYGKDDRGLWSNGEIALGRRLHRILPEDKFDKQPLISKDGRLTLVADVRLDNRDEICALLDLSSARTPDSEILLSCLERFGEQAFDRICGDYAFALWDSNTRRLVLARDGIGNRPLHFHRGKNFLAFASMPKGLHALPEIPMAPDLEAMACWVALEMRDDTRSFFAGIEKVLPACFVTAQSRHIENRRHWRPKGPPTGPWARRDDLVEGLRFHLDQAVRSCMRGSNGVIASHLSAGLDSSAVTATAARLAPGDKVLAFTAVPRKGFEQPASASGNWNEGPLASEVAALYSNITHSLIRTDRQSPLDTLDRNYFLFDGPALNLCNMVWLSAINAAAQARGASILLTGGIGNMTLSYDGMSYLPELLRNGQFAALRREAAALTRTGRATWRQVLWISLAPYLTPKMRRAIRAITRRQAPGILDYSALNPAQLPGIEEKIAIAPKGRFSFMTSWRGSAESRIRLLCNLDMGLHNKGMLAGYGIDQRDPTADRRLVEFCLQIPLSEYLSEGTPRALAKRALSDRLPPALLTAKQKGLQAADWHEGLTAAYDELREEVERIANCGGAREILDIAKMQALTLNWPDPKDWTNEDIVTSYRLALLRSVSAGHFLRKATGSNA